MTFFQYFFLIELFEKIRDLFFREQIEDQLEVGKNLVYYLMSREEIASKFIGNYFVRLWSELDCVMKGAIFSVICKEDIREAIWRYPNWDNDYLIIYYQKLLHSDHIQETRRDAINFYFEGTCVGEAFDDVLRDVLLQDMRNLILAYANVYQFGQPVKRRLRFLHAFDCKPRVVVHDD